MKNRKVQQTLADIYQKIDSFQSDIYKEVEFFQREVEFFQKEMNIKLDISLKTFLLNLDDTHQIISDIYKEIQKKS